jgi:ATP-dependent DNA ligase
MIAVGMTMPRHDAKVVQYGPVRPMLAAPVDALPEGPGWAYEPKFDGWRAIAFRSDGAVQLRSRAGRLLSDYFPDITQAVRGSLPPAVVLDGELIVWRQNRTSFAMLQGRVTAGRHVLRIAQACPAHYVVFDLLRDADGRELLDAPLSERRARLADLLARAPVQLPLCPQTTDLTQARQWLTAWTLTGVEGVVAKRLDSPYQPGRRGWRKHRARTTTAAVIGGVTNAISDPDILLLGRFDAAGRLRFVGCSHPLSRPQRRDLGAVLTSVEHRRGGGAGHPWPQPVPAGWSGRFQRPQPLPYVPIQPTIVVEIEVDTAFEHGRWRHRVRYVRHRAESDPMQVPAWSPDAFET